MNNKDTFSFSDFTFENYRNMIFSARKNYIFKFFDEPIIDQSFVIWRHDIDFSIEHAFKIAEIESDLDIQSTWFILLHSEFYNPLEIHEIKTIKRIISLGHKIGLHFDDSFFSIDSTENLETKLLQEKTILENYLDVEVKVFAFHNTSEFASKCLLNSYAGLVNAGGTTFRTKINYCSDSNGYWRFENLLKIIEQKKYIRLQALTHPIWWQETIMSPKQKIIACIENRAQYCKQYYDQLLHAGGRNNIDW